MMEQASPILKPQNQQSDRRNENKQVPQKGKLGNRKKNKNENILCAIIALMKELDRGGLEFVKMDCMKRLNAGSEEDSGEENMEVVDDHKYVMADK